MTRRTQKLKTFDDLTESQKESVRRKMRNDRMRVSLDLAVMRRDRAQKTGDVRQFDYARGQIEAYEKALSLIQ